MVVKILPFPSKLGAGLEDRTLDANSSKPGNIFLMAMMIIFLHCNQGLFLLLNRSRRVFSTQSNPYQALVIFFTFLQQLNEESPEEEAAAVEGS